MKRGKSKELLIEHLKEYIPFVLKDKKMSDEIITHLNSEYNVDKGSFMYMLSDYNVLADQDISFIGLLTEQISLKVDGAINDLDISDWFNDYEIKAMRKYVYADDTKDDEITLPFVFENAIDLGDGVIAVAVDNIIIARLRKYHLLTYNFEIQREAKIVNIGGENRKIMKIVHTNVNEMKELILEGKLMKTALAYNCAVDTSDDESGLEMFYDDSKRTLTVYEGTQIDIVDGTHRTEAFYEAYKKNRDIDGRTIVHFTNYTTKQAQNYQVQLSKQTPIPKARIDMLKENTHSTTLVNRLNAEGQLRDKISVNGRSMKKDIQLVVFEDLVNGFEMYWKPEKPRDINKIKDTFNEYLEYALEYFDELDEKNIYKKLLLDKKLFIGHISLAKKMIDEDISFEKINTILDNCVREDIETLLDIKGKLIKNKSSNKPYHDLSVYFTNLIKK